MNKIMFEKLSVKDQKEVTAGANIVSTPTGISPLTVSYQCLNIH